MVLSFLLSRLPSADDGQSPALSGGNAVAGQALDSLETQRDASYIEAKVMSGHSTPFAHGTLWKGLTLSVCHDELRLSSGRIDSLEVLPNGIR
jgi:hypothetical protein